LVADLLSFTQNWCNHVAWFCHTSKIKWNTKFKKHSYKNKACSQHGDKWQTDAIGLQKCNLAFPSHILSPRQLQQ
jgi:hypothetical protein